jgi:hypothetical protein
MSRGLGRTYWVMWAAASASFVGEGIQFGALPLLAASRRAGSGAGRGQPSVARAGRGCAVLWRHKLLRALASLLLVVNLVGTGVVAILVLYVLQVLELPEAGFGWLVATYAVGGSARSRRRGCRGGWPRSSA